MKGIKWHYILLLGLSIFVAISVVVFWPEPSARQTPPTPSELVIPWDEAKNYAGEIRIVEGRVFGATFDSGSMGKPTFLHIGKPYLAPDRFSVLIWSDHRGKFVDKFLPNPETYLLNRTVRVRGFIDTSKGYPEIVLSDPADISVVDIDDCLVLDRRAMMRVALDKRKDRATVSLSTVNSGITSAMVDYHSLCTAVTPACRAESRGIEKK